MQMAPAPEWADFLQYCGRALRARSLRFLVPQIEALKARRHLAKTSISFAGAGAKTCGLNALAHNLCLKYIGLKKTRKACPVCKEPPRVLLQFLRRGLFLIA